MREYVKQAKDFLASCNATMKITLLGKAVNENWGENEPRNNYRVTIATPRGRMQIRFWDSIHCTKNNITPTEYDIIACLQKYEVGTIDDFVSEFGYEVHELADVKRIQKTYKAVVNEYKKICRCFTEEQIEAMQEIQ
jgi:hypothetical protein